MDTKQELESILKKLAEIYEEADGSVRESVEEAFESIDNAVDTLGR